MSNHCIQLVIGDVAVLVTVRVDNEEVDSTFSLLSTIDIINLINDIKHIDEIDVTNHFISETPNESRKLLFDAFFPENVNLLDEYDAEK